jgi:quercetin dioxygenase-like cupin family protein
MVVVKPYEENKTGNFILREFKNEVAQHDLVWHQDKKDRAVTVINGTGWKLQIDSGLPFPLKEGKTYNIPAKTWHRILRGTSTLKILIEEFTE